MAFQRIVNVALSVSLFGVAGMALVNGVQAGATPLTPWFLCAIAAMGASGLVLELAKSRDRARLFEASTTGLRTLTEKLEESLATVSAMNARLHESEVRYKGLVDAQGDAIFRRSPDSRLTYGNDAFFRLFGLKQQHAIGQAFAAQLHPDSETSAFLSHANLDASRERVRYDQRVRTVYGWRWIAWEDYTVCDAFGRPIEVQSVGRDVTERKALEDALTEARDRAEAANRAKSRFLATMSHEIRTPMNGVLGMARLLLETKMLPAQKSYAEAIEQSGEALLSLIEEILDFSRIESGAIDLDQVEVDIRAVAEAVVELLAPRTHAKGIEIVAVFAPDTPALIRADAMRLRQVLTNLVGNAVKFTERGGVRVDVLAAEMAGRRVVRFEIRDSGVGVPAAKWDDIFKEFVQADSTHARRFGGSGLGLAISKRLVEAMDGTIGVEARPGGGSLFWFAIPAPTLREAAPIERERLAHYRAAIVTRNAMLREGLAAQIQAAGGEVVSPWHPDGRGRPPSTAVDAVLVDAGTSGDIDLTQMPFGSTRSIVLLTPAARGKLGDLHNMGFAAYLVKPIRQSSLIDRIRARPDRRPIESVLREQELPPFDALPTASRREGGRRILRILLAEDNPINALLTRELLRRRGHDVTEVNCGEKAVAAMDEERFDIVLTDIHMPGVDGIETARRIRTAERAAARSPTPIVALTADVLDTGRQACQDAGMDGFLSKPIAPAELDAMLARLFSESPRAAAE